MQDRQKISIHALREEGDYRHHGRRSSGAISIHALREEGDLPVKPKRRGDVKFLSTPSARRATWRALARPTPTGYFYPRPPRGGRQRACRSLLKKSNFYPRPPRGGRRRLGLLVGDGGEISIHALREEGDRLAESDGCRRALFLSTPSARRATSDRTFRIMPSFNFYPRPPRGGRPYGLTADMSVSKFLSTPSARRATTAATRPPPFRWRFLSTPSARRATPSS